MFLVSPPEAGSQRREDSRKVWTTILRPTVGSFRMAQRRAPEELWCLLDGIEMVGSPEQIGCFLATLPQLGQKRNGREASIQWMRERERETEMSANSYSRRGHSSWLWSTAIAAHWDQCPQWKWICQVPTQMSPQGPIEKGSCAGVIW